MTALLEVRGVSKRFGGVHAVKDVSFSVRKGAVKALIGPNGAGKTTLFNLVSGVLAPDAGEILFRGEAIQGRPPHRVAALGLSRTFQHIRLFAGMTALENVMVGAFCRTEERSTAKGEATEILEFLGLEEVKGYHLNELPIAIQKKVGLARALATTTPATRVICRAAAGGIGAQNDTCGCFVLEGGA